MNTKITFAICFAASLMVSSQATAAVIEVILDTGPATATVGDSLDGIEPLDIGTAVAGPFAIPEIAGLELTVTGVSSNDDGEELNVTGTSLGINSDDDSDTDAFEAAFNQSVTLQFNKDVLVHSLDFVSFTSDEGFSFAGVPIGSGDVSGSIYTFPTPFEISANTDFSLFATAGTIGIEAFDIEVVPEPSSFALLGGLGLLGFARRRRSV